MNNKIHSLTKEELAYLAGFLDGDGSIFSQFVRRNDYKLKFQIRTTVNFTQKTSNKWLLHDFSSMLGCGVVRDRGDGCSELSIYQNDQVMALIKSLMPYLRLRSKVGKLALEVIKSLSKNQSASSFLETCLLVDKIVSLNFSNNRQITSDTVKEVLLSLKLLD